MSRSDAIAALLGAGLTVAGAASWSWPAAAIVAGCWLVVFAWWPMKRRSD
jgi:hypothetical protein